jgi:hypothetical protein
MREPEPEEEKVEPQVDILDDQESIEEEKEDE